MRRGAWGPRGMGVLRARSISPPRELREDQTVCGGGATVDFMAKWSQMGRHARRCDPATPGLALRPGGRAHEEQSPLVADQKA
jgi:hypothetical protein